MSSGWRFGAKAQVQGFRFRVQGSGTYWDDEGVLQQVAVDHGVEDVAVAIYTARREERMLGGEGHAREA